MPSSIMVDWNMIFVSETNFTIKILCAILHVANNTIIKETICL